MSTLIKIINTVENNGFLIGLAGVVFGLIAFVVGCA